jgi:Na+-driven multidrug efflux pump
MRIVGFVGARALQGTGDTRTPMLVNGSATGLNILLSVTLGLGVAGATRLGIVGVGDPPGGLDGSGRTDDRRTGE